MLEAKSFFILAIKSGGQARWHVPIILAPWRQKQGLKVQTLPGLWRVRPLSSKTRGLALWLSGNVCVPPTRHCLPISSTVKTKNLKPKRDAQSGLGILGDLVETLSTELFLQLCQSADNFYPSVLQTDQLPTLGRKAVFPLETGNFPRLHIHWGSDVDSSIFRNRAD